MVVESAKNTEVIAPHLRGMVRDIMTKQVTTADWSTSVIGVARTMALHQLRRILILNEDQQVVGVLSQRAVLRELLCESGEEASCVGELVDERPPVTVLPEVPLRNAALVLANKKIGCLPIVDANGHLLGVLSASDLLEHLSGQKNCCPDAEAFTFYNPEQDARSTIPAFIRRSNGDLVLPRSSLEDSGKLPSYVQLGYDGKHDRIIVQFIADPAEGDGSLKIKHSKEHSVILAGGFVSHFGLAGKANAFDVDSYEDGLRLILTPRTV